jgi:hypothetical protein
MRMFVLLGNKPAIKELLKNYKIEHGSLINTIFLASYNDPDFQDFKKTAKSFLDGVRAQNINAFKDSIKSMSPKEANEFMLKLYLSVLYDLQEQFNVMDFETFKDVALKMIAKMSLSATLNNANSGFEFGFNLLLRLNSMDEVLFVLNHELGHNVLDVILMEKKIDRFSLDEKKRIQIISIHEYFSDILAYAANGDVKRIDKLFNDNFLCNYCKDVDFNNFKILMEEGTRYPTYVCSVISLQSKSKGYRHC